MSSERSALGPLLIVALGSGSLWLAVKLMMRPVETSRTIARILRPRRPLEHLPADPVRTREAALFAALVALVLIALGVAGLVANF